MVTIIPIMKTQHKDNCSCDCCCSYHQHRLPCRNKPFNGFYLEAVTVCINYSDFLAVFLEENLCHFDRLVVVTSHDDSRTQELCSRYSVECVPTDAHTQHGECFNKGAAIHLGLAHLRHLDWILHLDADIILPRRFRNMLQLAALNRSCIYGADRMLVSGTEHWAKAKRDKEPQYRHRTLVKAPRHTPLGDRYIHHQYGYAPMGFFQLWHTSCHKPYPTVQGSAEHTDILFSLKWPQPNRLVLPTFKVFHLESEPSPMGTNWGGRKSKLFAN